MLLEKLGDIKEMILDQVKDFVQDRIITAGITWLIGLLNPAAAFIKACKLIYDVVMFFVNNASRIAKFVDTILDSVADIVRGNIGGVVDKIDDVLGQMVPIIIGFLASVIGLGGIGAEDPRDRPEAPEAGQPGPRLRDQDRPQARRPDHPRHRRVSGKKVKAKVAAGKAWVKGKVEAGKQWIKEADDAHGQAERQAEVAAAWAGQGSQDQYRCGRIAKLVGRRDQHSFRGRTAELDIRRMTRRHQRSVASLETLRAGRFQAHERQISFGRTLSTVATGWSTRVWTAIIEFMTIVRPM